MLHRLLTSHRSGEPMVVINDEAHHCYRMGEAAARKKASREESNEERAAALWFSAVKALHAQGRLAQVFDLSATPMYLRRPAGTTSEHFPWIVSDYPLSDAIEAGLTKIPRLPVADDSAHDSPVYRNLFEQTTPKSLATDMPPTVRGALETMHRHYRDSVAPAYGKHDVIPVMIVVANNIANATALFRWIAGYQDEKGRFYRGKLDVFSNVNFEGSGYVDQPRTLLVHSQLGDADDGGSALTRIAREQAELHAPTGANTKQRIQAIRDIFNTVGRRGEAGEHIRCVISVGMLTEGWDAKTVTHILGFRAFSSQLLCEQVTGRALRRTSFEPDPDTGQPRPEYANVFGVPYEFMRGVEMPPTPTPPREPYVVEPVDDREKLRIEFPNLSGYAWSAPEQTVKLNPEVVGEWRAEPPSNPTWTEATPAVGVSELQRAYDPPARQTIVWRLAAEAVKQYRINEKQRRSLFPSMVTATEEWLQHPSVTCPDDFAWLAEDPNLTEAAGRIAAAVYHSEGGPPSILPIYADTRDPMQPRLRSTNIRPFKTTQEPAWTTAKSELNKAPCHSKSLEWAVAAMLDEHPKIEAWARNFRLGWTIPWRDHDRDVWANYEPDFVARAIRDGEQPDLHIIIEAKGDIFDNATANAKADAVKTQWIPAVEATGDFGRWRYVYLTSNSDIEAEISRAVGGTGHE
ncbi:MAG: hypothetical protein F4038_02175 [Chloroflexi bacterium]|nr:hypothetical protein [Chloroflexota bacterium]MYJ91847.1 hypothetical protein [Chloroflexota bacterium]